MKFRSALRPPAHLSIFFLIAFQGLAATTETLGPSSRRTGLVISEIMYHPRPRADGMNAEFIEVFNSEPSAADLSGFQLSGDVDFIFPANTVIPPRSFMVVAQHRPTCRTFMASPAFSAASAI